MEYVTADELDKEQLTQLHNATLKVSDTCFELKKLCATVLVPTATLLALFTDKTLDSSVFIAAILVIVAFWLADSTGYYYQRKLRNAMTPLWQRRADRCAVAYAFVPQPKPVNAWRSAFNLSMSFYLILGILVGLGFALYGMDLIGSAPAGAHPS